MNEFTDAVQLFSKVLNSLKTKSISLGSPLEEFVVKTCGSDLSYVDNRKDAMGEHGFDFWRGIDTDRLRKSNIPKRLWYSESQQFPDFLFRATERDGRFFGGSILELKDSKGGKIGSFTNLKKDSINKDLLWKLVRWKRSCCVHCLLVRQKRLKKRSTLLRNIIIVPMSAS